MKIQGTIVYFNNAKGFGFVERKIPAEGGGFRLQRYFVGRACIDFMAQDPVRIGHVARFNISENNKATGRNNLSRAVDIDIYENTAQAEVAAEREASATESSVESADASAGLAFIRGGK